MKALMIIVLLLASGALAEAQQQQKLYRVGRLSGGTVDDRLSKANVEAFRDSLRAFGWIDGQTVAHEQRWSEDNPETLRRFAAELVQLPVDVMVANGSQMVRAAKNATNSIPIVMAASGADPVSAGFIASLARPGGNITGMSMLSAELDGKRIELLKAAVNRLKRIAVLQNPDFPQAENRWKETSAAGKSLGVQVEPWAVRTPQDIEVAFGRTGKARPDGLLVLTDPVVLERNRERIIALAFKHRLPAIYPWTIYVEESGLMSYSANLLDMHRRSAYYVDRILRGTKPADLPVEQPMKFEFVINLKTAKQLGVVIPQWTLMKADRVIQ
jgi:putative ABC transport system substrate-binding protein